MLVVSEQPDLAVSPGRSTQEQLERGWLLHFAQCPFPIPAEEDRAFLCTQRVGGLGHKNITFDPETSHVTGFRYESAEQARRLCALLADFSKSVTHWLAKTFPHYAESWRLDRATLRSEEEATRRLRMTAREDLLHVDAFPSRPSRGDRILRVYVNINEIEPRVCVTSDRFAELLERFGPQVGLPSPLRKAWIERLGAGLLSFVRPSGYLRTTYDQFMLRLHNYLKLNEQFQERCPKRFWNFAPGSAWLFFSDGVSHATLRGRCALEHSYFISPKALALPQESPVALLAQAARAAGLRRVA